MALNGQLGRHPSMAHFIKVIKKDAIKFDGLAARLDAGETVPPQGAIWAANTRRLETIVGRWVNNPNNHGGDAMFTFLRGISRNYNI